MHIKNSPDSYGLVARFFHWAMAVLVIYMLYRGYFGTHKALGMVILFLSLMRITWSLANQKVLYPSRVPRAQAMMARLMHYSLYALILVIPLSGWLLSSAAGKPISFYGIIDIPVILSKDSNLRHIFSVTHYWLTRVLIALVSLHIAAGLYHMIVLRDGIMERMTLKIF